MKLLFLLPKLAAIQERGETAEKEAPTIVVPPQLKFTKTSPTANKLDTAVSKLNDTGYAPVYCGSSRLILH